MAEQEEDNAGQPAEEVEDWETLYDREEEAEAARNAARIAAQGGQQGNDGQQGDQVGHGGQVGNQEGDGGLVGNQEGEGVPGGHQGVDVLEGDQEEDGGQQVQQLVDEFAEMRAELMESVYVRRLYRTDLVNGRQLCEVKASGRGVPKPIELHVDGQLNIDFYEVYENYFRFFYASEETRNPQFNYYVRIPSVLHLRSPDYEEERERNEFVSQFRWQYGMHMWIGSGFHLKYAVAEVQLIDNAGQFEYCMKIPSSPISCVYPCFDPSNGSMILGLFPVER